MLRKFSSITKFLMETSASYSYKPMRSMCSYREPSGVINDCENIRESLQQINDRWKGPLDHSTQKNTIFPFVFLLGNHSSGKSSFVNYLLQRKVQTSGVAPTDDSFTVIVPGPSDVDRDGPSFIGDPDMGFSGLQNFGASLIHHTQLKVRSNIAINDFMIVDSPGMIDSPKAKDPFGTNRSADMDRGYDFESVVKWYAHRADVILLFFDPDKPGTTGETLTILTNALSGMDHKLYIILNKADQFTKIHDFARAYGSLCWNLSKVIQRKDLPRIYTMCLPPQYQTTISPGLDSRSGEGMTSLKESLQDLESTREDVVSEVMSAPLRRQDNEISRLSESVQLLQMHCNVLDNVITQYHKRRWGFRFVMFGSLTFTIGAVSSLGYILQAPEPVVLASSVGTLALVGMHYVQSKSLENFSKMITNPDESTGLASVYSKLYARSIADKDVYVSSLWAKVLNHMRMTLHPSDLEKVGRINNGDFDALKYIFETELQNLRRRSAPQLTPSKYSKPKDSK